MSSTQTAGHQWRFFRSGGFDQVALSSGDDLRNLAQLDPKLWTVLNCPTTGLEFDARTAALLDSDGDGQIRVPEILAAVQWACSRVVDADLFFKDPGLPVNAIVDNDAEGAALQQTASRILSYLSKDPQSVLQVSDFVDMSALFAPGNLNGDGIVTAALSSDPEAQTLLGEIIATQGPAADRSGTDGVSADTLTAFFAQAASVVAWHEAGAADAASIHRLGDNTAAAAQVFQQLRAKVDDYFMRCQLASFDARASEVLNPAPAVYSALATRAIASDDADIAALPLAAIAADKALPLREGLNPAWAAAVQALHSTVIVPLLGKRDSLSAADRNAISEQLYAWLAWQSARPATQVHTLGVERLREILAGTGQAQIAALIADDLTANGFATHVESVERLVRFQRDLVTLLQNFVTLSDFYRGQKKAIFQVGTLYLDQRSCELVLRVNDIARHATMAPFSGCYLVYCQCERKGEAPMAIVAALTGGDVDELMVAGRNGHQGGRAARQPAAGVLVALSPHCQLCGNPAAQFCSVPRQGHRGQDHHWRQRQCACSRGAGLRHRQVRRYLRRLRPGGRCAGHGPRRRDEQPFHSGLVADAAGGGRRGPCDFRAGHDHGVSHPAPPQSRPAAGCQWLGGEHPRAHQRAIRGLDDRRCQPARRGQPLAQRSVCREEAPLETLAGAAGHCGGTGGRLAAGRPAPVRQARGGLL